MFFSLNAVFTGNMSLILFNEREANLKEKAIGKMISGQVNLLRSAFHLWRN